MNHQTLSSICEQVYRRYPQVSGCHPKVQDRANGQFLLIFNGTSKAADGRTINHTVRVVTGADGKVVKMTASK